MKNIHLSPKEIQKQHLIDMMKADEEIGLYEELKQETVKEAAEKFYPPKTTDLICSPKLVRDSFIAGAKWQQEQNKNMYSEEIINILDNVRYWDTCPDKYINIIESFLKQFKKK